MKTARPADARLVRKAAWVIAAQTAAAVAVVVAGMALLVLVFTVQEQHTDAQRIVRNAALSANDVTSDQPELFLLMSTAPGDPAIASQGTPQALRHQDIRALPIGESTIQAPRPGHDGDDRAEYLVYAADHDGRRMVAALDTRYRAYETQRLETSLSIAGAIGICAAAGVGWLIGRRAVRPLSDALSLQRRFVADASHELRTPLTILHTRAQLIGRRANTGLDERTRRDIEELRRDTRVLTEIVNDLLLSAELQHRPDASAPVDLVALAYDVAGSFQAVAEDRGIDVVVDAPSSPVTVSGVTVALRRAVNALVDNALAHSHRGGTIALRVAADAAGVILSVIDTGDGFDPREADALTGRFTRGPQTLGRGRRFGLGLSLVREVVQAHGGTLTLTGQVGEGAQADLNFPV